jgi:hypothetical protein
MTNNFNISFIVIIFILILFVIMAVIYRNKNLSPKNKNNDIENFNYDDKETERYTNINNIFQKIRKFFIEDFQNNLNCKLNKDVLKLLDKNFDYISNCCMRKILQVYKNNYFVILKNLENFPEVAKDCLNKGIDLNECVQENQIQSVYFILNNLKIKKSNDIQYNKLIEKIILYILSNKIKFGYKKCEYLKFCEFDFQEIKILNNFRM